ncbi:MAG: selenocysteine-specific translation elongation factor [Chloroflexi bacterium]|nr:selenocysteine-specific translation elongation factor [Chloroflexota bacterium]
MAIIGTAGHVDHGKSTLVRALTGINPDRLKEEQEREMTIDLGFAWLTLPSGRSVGVVDVPGHEDFVRNMLAGVGGVDVAMLVIAADEGVMPQTREHLAILDLLQVPRGVIALTKSDLVDDPEWLELVQEQVREEVHGSVLADAPCIPVSARTGAGLPELLTELDRQVAAAPARLDLGRPRMWIDRVFTVAGFGTVVTGTLLDGHLEVGDEVQIVPGERRARIRGLQLHKAQVTRAEPGSRLAINLTGVGKDELVRGQVVARPGALTGTDLVDARLTVLGELEAPLEHDAQVELHVGAAHTLAYVRLLDSEHLEPGQTGWIQLRLDEPVAVLHGDRFVLRSPSPSRTIGGGSIVRAQPLRRHKRFRPEVLAELEALSRGTPDELLLQALGGALGVRASELVRQVNLPQEQVLGALSELLERGDVLVLEGREAGAATVDLRSATVIARRRWEALAQEIRSALGGYHQQYPLRIGMPREELKSRLRVDGATFQRMLDKAVCEGVLAASEAEVHLPEHRVTLNSDQQRRLDQALTQMAASPYAPPALSELQDLLGAELLQYLLDAGRLLKVSDSVVFDPASYAEMEQRVIAYLRENGQITVAIVRDLFGTSRKYALGLLEDLDARRVTKRLGDVRVLR